MTGCERLAKKRGICLVHYDRYRKRGNLAYEAQVVRNVKLARAALGLSQRELAQEIGTSKSAIWRMEKGTPVLYSTVRKVHLGLRRLIREKKREIARRAS